MIKEPSDCKVQPLLDVWRSATTMAGGLCVMMDGAMQMPEFSVCSWVCQVRVST